MENVIRKIPENSASGTRGGKRLGDFLGRFVQMKPCPFKIEANADAAMLFSGDCVYFNTLAKYFEHFQQQPDSSKATYAFSI
jgi:hypothetical protein